MRNPYATLGVDEDAPLPTIRSRYRELCWRHHPDAGRDPDARRMAEINTAWQALKTPHAREATDAALRRQQRFGADGMSTTHPRQPSSGTPGWGEPTTPRVTPSPPSGETPHDPNLVAIESAGLCQEMAEWLRQVAAQVYWRLDLISSDWRSTPHACAARACAFGLLLGHLARVYPRTRSELSRVAEVHLSYLPLEAGARLDTLAHISADPQRMVAWMGPLVNVGDPCVMRTLID